jgi:hypothetical protein
MSYPTPLGPWFVVQRLNYDEHDVPRFMEYYQHSEEGNGLWTPNKKLALLLMSLHQAARVAEAETAEVRVLSSKAEADEFGRG